MSKLSLEDTKGASMEDLVRTVRYKLPKEFLKFKTVRTLLKFCVGPKEVPNFRMIERHYFKGELLRNYDFTFGFCIPNSTNTWEAVYDMPVNTEERIEEMVSRVLADAKFFLLPTGANARQDTDLTPPSSARL